MTDHVRAKIDVNGNVTYISMTAEEISDLEARSNPVPVAVSPYQARVALLQAGHLAAVESIMANPETPAAARLAWEYATVVERQSPFIATLAPLLGLSESQVDDLFRAAAQVS